MPQPPEPPPAVNLLDYISDYNSRKFDDAERELLTKYFSDLEPECEPWAYWAPWVVKWCADRFQAARRVEAAVLKASEAQLKLAQGNEQRAEAARARAEAAQARAEAKLARVEAELARVEAELAERGDAL